MFQKISGCVLRNKSVQNLKNILATVLSVRAGSVDRRSSGILKFHQYMFPLPRGMLFVCLFVF